MKNTPSLFFRLLYEALQWTWGLMQNLTALILWAFLRLRYGQMKSIPFHGARLIFWPLRGSMALGQFIFFGHRGCSDEEEIRVHEYGHTVQSAFLGPLYLPLIGLPSLLWASLPYFERRRKSRKLSYTDIFCESWASRWGEKVLKEPAAWT